MSEFSGFAQPLQLDVSTERCKQRVGLRGERKKRPCPVHNNRRRVPRGLRLLASAPIALAALCPSAGLQHVAPRRLSPTTPLPQPLLTAPP